jgi:hypothetical protein
VFVNWTLQQVSLEFKLKFIVNRMLGRCYTYCVLRVLLHDYGWNSKGIKPRLPVHHAVCSFSLIFVYFFFRHFITSMKTVMFIVKDGSNPNKRNIVFLKFFSFIDVLDI